MPDMYVTDLDDTLIMSTGDARPELLSILVQALNAGEQVVVVSGRPVSQLDSTMTWLRDNGLDIPEADVHLDDFPAGSPVIDFKLWKAQRMLDEGADISVWFENDRATREGLAALGIEVMNPADIPTRTIRAIADVPAYMRDAAAKGVKFYEDGFAGDGVTAQTVREARNMADGIITADKWVRVAAWVARHRMDWEDVPRNNDSSREDYPGAGAVAALLWGVDPTIDGSADRVIAYAKAASGGQSNGSERMNESRAASGASDLPIGDRNTAWDGVAAEGRVREWAGGMDNMDWAKYGRAFFWVDESAPDQFGSYKLQFADIVNGELTAMPRGIFAVGAILAGSRGGVDLPAADRGDVEAKVAAWYDKLSTEFDDSSIEAPFMRSVPLSVTERMLVLRSMFKVGA